MSDIARLGLAIDTTGATEAKKALDDLPQSANKAEKAFSKTEQAAQRSNKAMADYAKQQTAVNRATTEAERINAAAGMGNYAAQIRNASDQLRNALGISQNFSKSEQEVVNTLLKRNIALKMSGEQQAVFNALSQAGTTANTATGKAISALAAEHYALGAATRAGAAEVAAYEFKASDLRRGLRVLKPLAAEAGASISQLGMFAGAARAGMGGLAVAITGGLIVALESAADKARIMQGRLKDLIGNGPGERAFDRMRDSARDAGVPIDTMSSSVETLTKALRAANQNSNFRFAPTDGGAEAADMLGKGYASAGKAIATLDRAMQSNGLTAAEQKAALDNLTGSLAKNKGLTAEAFAQLETDSPKAAQKLAKGLGYGVAQIELLNASLRQTPATLSEVIRALSKVQPEVDALKIDKTIPQGVDEISAAWHEMVTEMGKAGGFTVAADLLKATSGRIRELGQDVQSGRGVWESFWAYLDKGADSGTAAIGRMADAIKDALVAKVIAGVNAAKTALADLWASIRNGAAGPAENAALNTAPSAQSDMKAFNGRLYSNQDAQIEAMARAIDNVTREAPATTQFFDQLRSGLGQTATEAHAAGAGLNTIDAPLGATATAAQNAGPALDSLSNSASNLAGSAESAAGRVAAAFAAIDSANASSGGGGSYGDQTGIQAADVGNNASGGIYRVSGSGGTDSIPLTGNVSPGEVVAILPQGAADQNLLAALQQAIGHSPISLGPGGINATTTTHAIAAPASYNASETLNRALGGISPGTSGTGLTQDQVNAALARVDAQIAASQAAGTSTAGTASAIANATATAAATKVAKTYSIAPGLGITIDANGQATIAYGGVQMGKSSDHWTYASQPYGDTGGGGGGGGAASATSRITDSNIGSGRTSSAGGRTSSGGNNPAGKLSDILPKGMTKDDHIRPISFPGSDALPSSGPANDLSRLAGYRELAGSSNYPSLNEFLGKGGGPSAGFEADQALSKRFGYAVDSRGYPQIIPSGPEGGGRPMMNPYQRGMETPITSFPRSRDANAIADARAWADNMKPQSTKDWQQSWGDRGGWVPLVGGGYGPATGLERTSNGKWGTPKGNGSSVEIGDLEIGGVGSGTGGWGSGWGGATGSGWSGGSFGGSDYNSFDSYNGSEYGGFYNPYSAFSDSPGNYNYSSGTSFDGNWGGYSGSYGSYGSNYDNWGGSSTGYNDYSSGSYYGAYDSSGSSGADYYGGAWAKGGGFTVPNVGGGGIDSVRTVLDLTPGEKVSIDPTGGTGIYAGAFAGGGMITVGGSFASRTQASINAAGAVTPSQLTGGYIWANPNYTQPPVPSQSGSQPFGPSAPAVSQPLPSSDRSPIFNSRGDPYAAESPPLNTFSIGGGGSDAPSKTIGQNGGVVINGGITIETPSPQAFTSQLSRAAMRRTLSSLGG